MTPIQSSLKPDLRGAHGILALGRLKDGVPLETASAEVSKIAQQLATQYPDSDGGRGGTVVPLVEIVVGSIRPTLWLLLSAALLLLLIACVNASGLLLLRFQGRQQEIAVRGALGASPARLVRQFTTEAIGLAMAANVTGLFAAFGTIRLLRKLIPLNFLVAMPYLNALGLNRHVLFSPRGLDWRPRYCSHSLEYSAHLWQTFGPVSLRARALREQYGGGSEPISWWSNCVRQRFSLSEPGCFRGAFTN